MPYWLNELNSFAASNFVLTAKWRANPDFPMDFLDCTPFSSVSFLPFIKVIPAFAVASHRRTPSNQKFTGYRVRFLSLRYIFQKFFISLFCKTYFYFFTPLINLKKYIIPQLSPFRINTCSFYFIPFIKNCFFPKRRCRFYSFSADCPFISGLRLFIIYLIKEPSINDNIRYQTNTKSPIKMPVVLAKFFLSL